jgi:hypothetical protein
VVGGAVEHILGAVMRASGIPVVNRGHAESGLDLRTHDAGFSVKATFQTGWADLRLINSLGSSAQRVWKEPTILVLGARGVGYVDPQLLPGATKSSGDALVLPGRAYREFLSAVPEYLCAVPVPLSPSNRQASKLASYAVAEEILGRIQFARLRRFRTSAT